MDQGGLGQQYNENYRTDACPKDREEKEKEASDNPKNTPTGENRLDKKIHSRRGEDSKTLN